MTFDSLNNNNNSNNSSNKLVSVKLDFYGELRRFSTLGTSFRTLVDEIISVLSIGKGKEIVVKYRDEEGDLITMSTDMELKAALSGSLLRLQVSYPKGDTVMGNGEEEKSAPPAVLYSEVQQPPPAFYPQGVPFVHHPIPMEGTPFFGPPSFPPMQPLNAEGQPTTTPVFVGPFGGRRGGRGGFGFGRGGWGHGPHGHGFGHHGHHHQHKECQWNPNAPWVSEANNLVDQILQMGFDVKREKVFKLLKKFDGDVDQVTRKLMWKKEKKALRDAKKQMKEATKEK